MQKNAKLTPCVLQLLKEDEARSNTARFGDLTLSIQTSQVRRRIRMASPGQEGPTLDESVHGLDLNAAVGLTSYSNDELWRAHGPQTSQAHCRGKDHGRKGCAANPYQNCPLRPSSEGNCRV